ncbi:hypothetical protein T09_14835 [Trichinella sp. T9]|nr:hypothetical protein T09_14835 [Trichinella sp. T9]
MENSLELNTWNKLHIAHVNTQHFNLMEAASNRQEKDIEHLIYQLYINSSLCNAPLISISNIVSLSH